jgi:hypothetical protein
MAGKYTDLLLVYQFIKRLTTPFKESDAFKLGIIDDKGKKLKSPESTEEHNAYGYFDRLVFNIKKLLEKLPGGKSRLASYAAALFLIKEANSEREFTEKELAQGLYESMEDLDKRSLKKLNEIANVTGPAVPGTGDDVASWKGDARKKEMKAFLRRYMQEREKRQKVKEKKEFLKKLGLG